MILVKKLHPDAILPTQAYPGDAGWDLHVLEDTVIRAGRGADVRTGLAVAIPEGYYGRIVGRSSAFRRRGLQIQEGIIDAGFRGELFSYVYYPLSGDKQMSTTRVEAGWSLAQLIIVPVPDLGWHEITNELPPSERGTAGFGSSGR